MTVLREQTKKDQISNFQMMIKIQSDANRTVQIMNCSTICQGYEVPGGCTPCGTKCMMYCAGK